MCARCPNARNVPNVPNVRVLVGVGPRAVGGLVDGGHQLDEVPRVRLRLRLRLRVRASNGDRVREEGAHRPVVGRPLVELDGELSPLYLAYISPISPLHLPCISLYLPCISLQVSAEETLRLIATFAYPVGQVHEI